MSKLKKMSLKRYFECINPEYTYLEIIPLKSLRNYNSDRIVQLVSTIYKKLSQRIMKENKKYFFTSQFKLTYYIVMKKNEAHFYFVIPTEFLQLFSEKISETWHNVTINKVDDIPMFSKNCTKYYLTYQKEDALSLTTDKRNNTLLTSLMNSMQILEEGDMCGVIYNFIPAQQMGWKQKYDRTIEKMQNNEPIEKNKISRKYMLLLLAFAIIKAANFLTEFTSELLNGGKSNVNLTPKYNLNLQSETIKKRNSNIVKTQILVMSESENKKREECLGQSLCESFSILDCDNKLIAKKLDGDITRGQKQKGAETIICTPDEAQNFVSLPARELIEEHKLTCIDLTETDVPEELQKGYICLGDNVCKGHKQKAYLRDTYDIGNFPLVLLGEQGSGKTTFISNYVHDIQARQEGCILIDFIKNCELAQTVENSISDKDNLIVLDMSDTDQVQGIGYNELLPKDAKPVSQLEVANRKALYVSMLIDALNSDGEPLTSNMDRYLNAASNVVFLNPDASMKDVIRCLENYKYRQEQIAKIPLPLKSYLEDEISSLEELNSHSDGEVDGTKTAKIDGILHRIGLLRKDFRLKLMFNKPCSENINLVKAMEEGKIILVKMPQEYYATPYSKNVVVTYLFTKIWAAMLVRGSIHDKPKRFHVIVDEIFQAKTAMQLLRNQEILPQTRKFGCRYVFSAQYQKQLEIIAQTLKSAGASFMLMKGSARGNFNEFKNEIEPFTLEDLYALPQYHCLNLINYEKGIAKFVTKLPKPLK